MLSLLPTPPDSSSSSSINTIIMSVTSLYLIFTTVILVVNTYSPDRHKVQYCKLCHNDTDHLQEMFKFDYYVLADICKAWPKEK